LGISDFGGGAVSHVRLAAKYQPVSCGVEVAQRYNARQGVSMGDKQDFGTDRIAKPTVPLGDATQPSPALAALVLVEGDAEVHVYPLLADNLVIGRGKECHIRALDDGAVSRKHASVTRDGVRFMLQDLGSSNGVYVNDKRIEGPHELRVGDRVEIGKQTFVFKRRA
jgi:pSer/pThr/pTyr-binding forkhead associated (FHA) protein